MNSFTRRRFLKVGMGALAGSGLVLGDNPLQTLTQAAEANTLGNDDYRAMVCVFLEGGCDGFSLMVPTDTADYNEYAGSRGALAVPQSALLGISPRTTLSSSLGLHPNAAALQQLFQDEQLAMIANVGNLVEPTTAEQYEALSVELPEQLFSHADQEIQWQQLQGSGRATTGWGAMAASHLRQHQQQQRDYLTSITLAGSNHWQAGFGQRPFSLSENGVLEYAGMDANKDWSATRRDAFRRVLDIPQSHVLAQTYSDLQRRAMDITTELGAVLVSNTGLLEQIPEENSLAQQLSMVAQLIGAREQLGMRRQIFYVRMSGFDVHDHQNRELPELFGQLSEGLAFFQRSLNNMGVAQNVTTFTASDFGRALSSNGDGTDHGWGNHLMVMGGAVRGGDVYGSLPRLSVDGPDSVSHGRVLPTLGASQYAATVLDWLGLENDALHNVLPTLRNFEQHNLGFMA